MTSNQINSIDRGIVFLTAEWSGQAKWAHKYLTNFLDERGTEVKTFVYSNVDQEPDVYNLPEFSGKIHSFAEAAVAKEGRIVFVTTLGKDKDLIAQRGEELLRFYQA